MVVEKVVERVVERVIARIMERVVESEMRVIERNGRESHGELEERFIEECIIDMVMEGLV